MHTCICMDVCMYVCVFYIQIYIYVCIRNICIYLCVFISICNIACIYICIVFVVMVNGWLMWMVNASRNNEECKHVVYLYIYMKVCIVYLHVWIWYMIYIYICVLVCIYIYNYMIVYVRIRSMTHLSKETCVWFKQELSGASLVFFFMFRYPLTLTAFDIDVCNFGVQWHSGLFEKWLSQNHSSIIMFPTKTARAKYKNV